MGASAQPQPTRLVGSDVARPAPVQSAASTSQLGQSDSAIGSPTDGTAFFKEVLFTWMGVHETDVLYFSPSERRYRLRGGSAAQLDMFEMLQDVGSSVRQLDDLLKTRSHSFLQQSLKAAVRKQLTSFFYFVSSIRDQSSISFSSLSVAAMKVRTKLGLMLSLLQSTENAKGGELATKLEAFHRQGSYRLKDLVQEIYTETMNPLLQMTVQWLTKGESPDPFVEFFVVANERVKDTDEAFWVSKYSLRPDMLPVTVSLQMADKIMLVAKNIAFIRRTCRAKDWVMDPSIVAMSQDADFNTLPRVVDDAVRYSNQSVLHLLNEKFKFDDVMSVVKAFFLVGNGNFFEVLIQRLDPILSRMSNHVMLSSVRDQLKSSLLDTVSQTKHLNTDLFSTLDCEVEKDDRLIGWDAFSLTMAVPPPLNNIFDSGSMRQYRQLFRLMLTVKRSEVALKQAWRQSVILDRIMVRMKRSAPEAIAFKEVVNDAHLLGMEMLHLVSNLWSYFVYEVSMAAWAKFQTSLSQCKSVDDVRQAHDAYLADLKTHSLLHKEFTSTRRNIETILQLSRRYCAAQNDLTALLERRQGDVVAIKGVYQIIADELHREMSQLLTTLEEKNLQFDFMNFLQLRLNFNQYYHDNTARGATNTEF